jgi:hypothetical protein
VTPNPSKSEGPPFQGGVVSHLLTEGAEILQGRCPLGPLSPDCDATPAPSGGQALLAEAGQGTIVLAADPNRHLGGAQFDDLDEREPDAIAAAVARLNETIGPRFAEGAYHPVRRGGGAPDGFRLTSPDDDGLLADCSRWRCIMEPGVTAVILFSYPGIIVTELSSPFAELQLRIQGDIRRLGPERHIHAGQFRVVPEEGGWRAAWEGPMRYIQFSEPGGGPAR